MFVNQSVPPQPVALANKGTSLASLQNTTISEESGCDSARTEDLQQAYWKLSQQLFRGFGKMS